MRNGGDEETQVLVVCRDREHSCSLESGYKEEIDVPGNHFEYTYAKHERKGIP